MLWVWLRWVVLVRLGEPVAEADGRGGEGAELAEGAGAALAALETSCH